MLSQAQRTTILELNAQHVSKREIARVLGISRVAVRKVLRSNSTALPELHRAEKAEPHRQQILELFEKCKGNLVRVHEDLAAAGAEMSYPALTAFCRRHGIGYAPPTPAGQYAFAPGEELQHDTSPHDLELGGRKRKVQTASAVLCYSRMLFFQCYPNFRRFDCKVFLTDGLRYMGGATARVMIDNTHVVVLRGSGRDLVPVPEMAAFGERFSFQFVAHAIGNANRSGRVERPFHFIENNFLAGRTFTSWEDLNQRAREWCDKVKDDWTQVRPEVAVKQVAISPGEETYILCRTAGRQEKEKAIRQRFSTRMEDALQRLQKTIAAGRLKDRHKMERRLGKIQARHPQVNDLFEVTLRDTPLGVRLEWEMKAERTAWRALREGAYLLRTNVQADSAEQLWSQYMQLTEAEASFRALKSELSIRPLFHQKEPRVKAHVMVAFLGYAMWVTLKHLLKRRPAIVPQASASGVNNAQPLSPMKALSLLSTLQSADIVLPTTDGREIRLRRITEPSAEQNSLLHQLRLSLPQQLHSRLKCSADSAIA
jgi:transposase